MLHCYMGIGLLAILPLTWNQSIQRGSRKNLWILGLSLFFLFVSLGQLLPLRGWLNHLPGFSYFRHPAIFRFYFMLFLLLYVAVTLKDVLFRDLVQHRVTTWVLGIIGLVSLFVLANYNQQIPSIFYSSHLNQVKKIRYEQLMLLSAVVQFLLCMFLLIFIWKSKNRWVHFVLLSDLVLNALLCTPFFTVSHYSPADVNEIFQSKPGFPVQTIRPSEVPATFTDENRNSWHNVNIFQKLASTADSYRGPLLLDQPIPGKNQTLLTAPFDSTATVNVLLQKPTKVLAQIDVDRSTVITLAQNNFPGWSAKVNGKEAAIMGRDQLRINESNRMLPPGISVEISAGHSTIEFKYERRDLQYFVITLNVIILGWIIWVIFRGIIRINRSSFP